MVNNVTPTVLLSADSWTILENEYATLTATISDPGTLDTFTLKLDWGDGSEIESRSIPANQTGSKSIILTHQYRDDPPGISSVPFTVRAVVADEDGPPVSFYDDFVAYGGHFYGLSSQAGDWLPAELDAQHAGGHLAAIGSSRKSSSS